MNLHIFVGSSLFFIYRYSVCLHVLLRSVDVICYWGAFVILSWCTVDNSPFSVVASVVIGWADFWNLEHVVPLNHLPTQTLARCGLSSINSPSLRARRTSGIITTVFLFPRPIGLQTVLLHHSFESPDSCSRLTPCPNWMLAPRRNFLVPPACQVSFSFSFALVDVSMSLFIVPPGVEFSLPPSASAIAFVPQCGTCWVGSEVNQ